MNYVERHFGDWARDTAHLSMLEDGAYNRLVDLYYVREQPLPADLPACCRLVRAVSAAERKAVKDVLAEFFYPTPEGWRHKRCDQEISKFKEGEPEREQKRANEDARMKRHREERARLFSILSEAGEHPAWNVPMAELRTLVQRHQQRTGNVAAGTEAVTGPATPATGPRTATHSPLPNTHSPETNTSEADASAAAAAPAEPLTAKDRAWLLGVALLGEKGRPLLGKLAATYGEEVLADALSEATRDQPIDPKAWLTAACEARAKAKPNGKHGAEPVDLLADPRPAWALQAGFSNRFEAENEGCSPRNAHQFRDGKRVKETPRSAA